MKTGVRSSLRWQAKPLVGIAITFVAMQRTMQRNGVRIPQKCTLTHYSVSKIVWNLSCKE